MTGTVLIDRYVLGAVLGRGGMGLVHEAVDLKLQREVAVKLLGSATATAESLRRFSREALAAGSLQHPNVVGVFDTGEQQGRPFLVTELLRGETLRQRLARGPVPVEQARAWALQLAAGLQVAHEKGLIHRDLKPSNIFITSDGWVKILDFGLVKLAESLPDLETHRPSGTIGYMAPEQVRGQPVDARADLFNFGLLLYEMLGGKRAFAEVSVTETSYAIVLREPAPLPDAVPLQLRRLVSRCLSKDRELRPASAKEILRLLQTKPPRSLWRFLPAAVLLLPFLAMGVLALQRARQPGPVQIASVAIFPFEGVSARTALSDGLSDLLNIDLQLHLVHSGDVDPARSAFVRTGSSALHRARSAALEMGAPQFVLGQVDERGGELAIEATLRETETNRVLTSAAARGKPDELLHLIRQVSDGLFEPKPLPHAELERRQLALEHKTTSSFPALLGWLESQQLFRDKKNLDEAVAPLKRAVSLDPGSALVQFELGRMAEIHEPEISEAAMERAVALGEHLSFTDRTIAQFMVLKVHGHPADAQEFLREANHAHPEDVDIRRLFSSYIFHRGPLLGHSPHEAAPYFRRQLELDPLDLEASTRLLELAQLRGQRTLAARFASTLVSHVQSGPDRAMYQLAEAWARGDAAEHEAALAQLRRLASHDMIQILLSLAATHMDGSNDLATLAALLPVGEGHQSFQPRAFVNLINGHIAAARRDVEDALAAGAAGDTAYYLPWIDTLDLVSPSPAQLTKARADAARLDVVKDPTRAAAREYLLGMLALRARDVKAAEASVHALEALPELPESSIVADHALALRARILAARGDPAAALALYDQQKIFIPDRYTHFYRRPRDHFFRASLLVALGRPREALPLYEALVVQNLIDPVFYPQQQLYMARVYDSLGEKREAIEHYQRFVAMWHDCDPEERPELERAQARLAELLEESK
ncbi:MAG TPA: protein kinase [Myxococcales bacterium]|nr:protein kinase [Myxococcales bacterium]